MSKNTWDYIIVGAGHNGLTAGCTLAMAGKSVLVVEQRFMPGGVSVSYPFVKEAPNHYLSIGAMDDALMAHSPLVDHLTLRQYGYDAKPLAAPYGWMNEDGDSLLLHRDFNRTVEEIRYFSPKDAQTYIDVRSAIDFVMGGLEMIMPHHPAHLPKMEIAKMLLGLAMDKKTRKIIQRMLSVSAFEMISETFESEAMRGLWSFWSCIFAPATVQASGLFLSSFGSVHRAGIFRPVGGMSGMITSMEKCFAAHGGEIRLNHKVEQFIMDGKQVKGVRIVGGQELFASEGVLANCAPQVALGQLLPESATDREFRNKVKFIPAHSVSVAPFKIDMAVGGPLTYPKAQAKRKLRDDMDVRKTTMMTGTLEQNMAHHEIYKRGEQADFLPPLYFSIMTANDESIAPKGQDVFYLYVNVPTQPIGGWTPECKQKYSAQIMTSVKRFVSGFDAEIGRIEHTPRDFEEGFGAPNGAYFHVDMLPTRMLMNRPAPGLGGYRTPFKGLYLASAGSHPSGGVCGWAGRLAAETAMGDAA